MRRLPAADGRGRGGRHGARQHAGPRPRARLGRLRRRLREPDARARAPAAPGAHVMALPYTPRPGRRRAASRSSTRLAGELHGMPVVCCGLHSQLAPSRRASARASGLRTSSSPAAPCPWRFGHGAAAQDASAARDRRSRSAPCLDGDARPHHRLRARLGEGERLRRRRLRHRPGHRRHRLRVRPRRLAVAEAANAAAALGGRPVVAVRYSDRRPRERHAVSHTTPARRCDSSSGAREVGVAVRASSGTSKTELEPGTPA